MWAMRNKVGVRATGNLALLIAVIYVWIGLWSAFSHTERLVIEPFGESAAIQPLNDVEPADPECMACEWERCSVPVIDVQDTITLSDVLCADWAPLYEAILPQRIVTTSTPRAPPA